MKSPFFSSLCGADEEQKHSSVFLLTSPGKHQLQSRLFFFLFFFLRSIFSLDSVCLVEGRGALSPLKSEVFASVINR